MNKNVIIPTSTGEVNLKELLKPFEQPESLINPIVSNEDIINIFDGLFQTFLLSNVFEINHNKQSIKNLLLKFSSDVCLWINDNTVYPVGSESIAIFKPLASIEKISIEGIKVIDNKATGIAIDVGSTGTNFWSGMGVLINYFKVRHVAKFLNLNKQNTYMWHFSNGFVSEVSDKAIHVIGESNSGEMLDFSHVRFFNNPGTILHCEAYASCTINLSYCSLDYSKLAVYVKNSCRVVLDNCWIETNTTMTPGEYFKLDTGAPQLIFNNCKFVLIDGDWSNINFIENNNGDVQINGGYLYFLGIDPTKKLKRLINDSGASSYSSVKNLKFATGETSPVLLGQNQNICYQGDFEGNLNTFVLTGPNAIDTITFYSGTKSFLWNHQTAEEHTLTFTFSIKEYQKVICNFAYKLSSVASGFFSAIIIWNDISGNLINSQTVLGAIFGTNNWTEQIRNNTLHYFLPPKGAVTGIFKMKLDSTCQANSKVWIDNLEIFIV